MPCMAVPIFGLGGAQTPALEVAEHYERGTKIATPVTTILLPTFVLRCIWYVMTKPSIMTAVFLWATLWANTVVGQDWSLLSAEEQAPYAAVGKLVKGRIGNQGLCTATLISPSHILTAAHCLDSASRGTPSQMRQFTFAAGWNDGQALATSSIADIYIPSEYERSDEKQLETLNFDWAIARLVDPISNVKPFPIVSVPGSWEQVYYLTYSPANTEAPLLTSGCDHRVMEQGPLQIACPARNGNSGAAVLVGNPTNPQIVGVIVAQARNNAFAVIPSEELLSLVSAMQ